LPEILTIAPEYAEEQPRPPHLSTVSLESTNPLMQELTGDTPVVEWVLPHFLARGSLVALAGMPGAGKSYLSYMAGFALATATPLLGIQPPRPFKVLYFDQENAQPDRIQYERWVWNGLGKPDLDLLCKNFWCCSFILGSSAWYTSAKAAVEHYRPEVIFIDTATPACNIQDENDNGEATRVIQNIRMLQATLSPPASAVVLKHAKLKSEEAGAGHTLRGAKAWEGAVDGIIYHIRGEGRPRRDGLSNTRLQPAKTRAFGLRQTINIEPRWLADHSGIALERIQVDGEVEIQP